MTEPPARRRESSAVPLAGLWTGQVVPGGDCKAIIQD
jgi:hypothetical protein